jgi:hypothetical protein
MTLTTLALLATVGPTVVLAIGVDLAVVLAAVRRWVRATSR